MAQKNTITISVDNIRANPFQPRKDFNEDGLKELSESIKAHGLIQPIVVRRTGDSYLLIAGERRLRACKMAGILDIPAMEIDIDGVDVAEVSLIENIQRKDLNCIEEASAFFILKSKFSMTQEEIAERLGKSRPYVANIIRLLDLPGDVRKSLSEGKISMGHGRALLGLPTEEMMIEVCDRILRDSLSVRQTESLIQEILSGGKIIKSRKPKVIKYFKEARVYYSSIKKALKEIKDAGGKADMIERETEDFYEIMVRIPKSEGVISEKSTDNS